MQVSNSHVLPLHAVLCAIFAATADRAAKADVPVYQVEVVATYSVTTTVRGASDAGHIVGDQIVVGQIRAFVATLDAGLTTLPLPPGYVSSSALDVNDAGVVVGTVADNGFPFDLGEPAIWTPDGSGGYSVHIPQQFATLPSPLGGNLAINGGMAVAINDLGTIVGWSRFQGFQGGPTTLFSLTAPPVNVGALGFDATVRDINNNDVLVGGGLRFDLDTGVATDLGVPAPLQPGNVSFTSVIAYCVNDSNEAVVAADLASVPTENYLTYLHNDAEGFQRLNPAQLPSRFVGFYDNNNRGDVSASGGILFAAEGVLAPDYAGLLHPDDANWTPALGFIADDRRVYTTATDGSTGENAIVVLVPIEPIPGDLDGDGQIGLADYDILAGCMGGPDNAIAIDCAPADIDDNGVVDVLDFAGFQVLFAGG